MLFVFFCTCGFVFNMENFIISFGCLLFLVLSFVVERAGGISYTNESL